MNLATALDIIDCDYAGALSCGEWQRHDHLDVDGIQASIWIKDGKYGLCCTGSNDGWDWARNFQLLPGWTGRGDSGRLYHRGIIKDARVIYAWSLRIPLAWVIGHSRGGGAAQIVGSSRAVRTVTFAAPKVLAPFQTQPPGWSEVANYTLGCDPVTWVPWGYSRVGTTHPLRCDGWGFAHGVASYRAVV